MQAANNLEQQRSFRCQRALPQSNLPWVEEAYSDLAQPNSTDLSVDLALSTLAARSTMANYQPQPAGATSISPGFGSLGLNSWLFSDEGTPFDWQRAIQQSELSIMDQFGSGYNDLLLSNVPNHIAAVDGFSCTPNTAPSSVAATRNTSPRSPTGAVFDYCYTPGSMATSVQASPSNTFETTRTPPSSTVLPSADEDRYLAAVGLAALPIVGDMASLSGQDNSADRFQWYGVEAAQPPSDENDAQLHSAQHWNGAQASFIHGNVETQAPVVRRPLTLAERKHNDKVLLEGKQKGETYKEIRMKLVGECPAESTLRGRYRVLTKALNDRVRRPTWTKTDIILLTSMVNQEFARIDRQVHNADTLSIRQKLSRVSWKTVADNIKANGGSYQFGVTTCKKKWIELNLPSNSPTAPAGADLDQRYD